MSGLRAAYLVGLPWHVASSWQAARSPGCWWSPGGAAVWADMLCEGSHMLTLWPMAVSESGGYSAVRFLGLVPEMLPQVAQTRSLLYPRFCYQNMQTY